MLRFFRRSRVLIGFLILAVGITVAFVQQARLTDRIGSKDNATRCQVVALVATFTENSARSAHATLASKLASADQKAAAQKNLDEVRKALATTSAVLGHPVGTSCQNLNP